MKLNTSEGSPEMALSKHTRLGVKEKSNILKESDIVNRSEN